MDDATLHLPGQDVRKLLAAASADGALVYLYLQAGGNLPEAETALRMPRHRLDLALASLRQLGLYDDEKPRLLQRQPPSYTERDIALEMERGPDFGMLVGEAQRRLGRILSTEELKILLSLRDYLGLPNEVIGILIHYCVQRNRGRGARPPSLRTIEKEAYRWADDGIDTLEEAAFYMQNQLERQSAVGRIRQAMGLGERKLTQAEEKYIIGWLELGFGTEEIMLAYEKTCLNTGAMKWPYCNSILNSWHQQGLHRVAEIQQGDARTGKKQPIPMGASGQLGELERQAIERLKRDFAQEG